MRAIPEPHNPTPREEIAGAGAQGQKLALAAMAVGLEDHRAMLQEKMRRVRADYDLTMGMLRRGAGVDPAAAPAEADVPGDIIIMGDTHQHTDAYHAPVKQQESTSGASAIPWKTAALVLGSLIGGGGIGAGVVGLTGEDPPAVVTPADPPATAHDGFDVQLETE